jgi:DNA invertase Pin-like site-specific DNA recombinase
MKPLNWRTRYGSYTRPAFTAPKRDHRQLAELETAYVAWLADTRFDGDKKAARKHCDKMDRRTLISAVHTSGDSDLPAIAKPAPRASRTPIREVKPVIRHVEPGLASSVRRAVIYARISKDSSDADNQLHQLRCWCLSRGHELVGEYIDIESGGKGIDERGELARMLADADAGQFDCVVVWALDRLSREGVFETLVYLRRLDAAGVVFASLSEPMISTDNTLVRDIVISVMASLAKAERQRISDRTKAGLERVRRTGSRSGKAIGRPALPADKIATITAMAGTHTKYAIAKAVGVHWKTVRKYLPLAA